MRNRNIFFSVTNILAVIMAAVLLTEFTPSAVPLVLAAENQKKGSEDKHEKDDGHDEHDEHKGEGEHHEEEVVKLSEDEIKEFGIEIGTAGPGNLHIFVDLPGEVRPNADRLAHVVPRVSGIIRSVRKKLGDMVRKGEVMAVIESRDLADAKSAFLSAKERTILAEANFNREEKLWKKKISPEREYLESKQALAEAKIELRSAEQKLHALGFTDKELARLPEHPDISFTRYEIAAPFDGTVIEKHISLGEVLKDDTEAFVIADLGTVWVDLNVYQKDLPHIRKGQPVTVSSGPGIPDAKGQIAYLGPVVGEKTRTVLARVVLPNPDGLLRPGLFVNGRVTVDEQEVPLLVRKTAIQTIEDEPVVFIQDEDGFEPRSVIIGRSDDLNAEIISGISAGQRYVAKGAFTLKAQLAKGSFESGHSH